MLEIPLEVSFEDDRGRITDLLTDAAIDAITLVTIKPGAVRGNHYHEQTVQWNYLISGVVDVHTASEAGGRVTTRLTAGRLLRVDAGERHAFLGVEDAAMIVFTRGPRGGKEYETDTFRLDEPLVSAAKQ
ncbi:MAG: cupin domain-containing protein [Thermoanaerobaculia bacterium]